VICFTYYFFSWWFNLGAGSGYSMIFLRRVEMPILSRGSLVSYPGRCHIKNKLALEEKMELGFII